MKTPAAMQGQFRDRYVNAAHAVVGVWPGQLILSSAQILAARKMARAGATLSEIKNALGITHSNKTFRKSLNRLNIKWHNPTNCAHRGVETCINQEVGFAAYKPRGRAE